MARRPKKTSRSKEVALSIVGVEPLLKSLDLLPSRVQTRVLKQSVNKSATPTLRAARRLAPLGDGQKPDGTPREHLRKTLTKTSPKFYDKWQTMVTVIGPRKKAAPHSHLVHDGTAKHNITLKKPLRLGKALLPAGFVIKHPGSKPTPFLTDALNATRVQSFNILKESIAKGIVREATKLGKKSLRRALK